jgi:hypothetical protein
MYIWPAAVSAPYVLGAARLILSTLAFFRRLPNPFSFSARSFSTCINILCTLIYILYIYFPYNIRFLLDVVIPHIRLGGGRAASSVGDSFVIIEKEKASPVLMAVEREKI